ncbi:DUF4190 domain-containing protein [Mycobacterium asiaticum]|nr:DUF4190 domain-containing protein [Mycobacterium asiaticum]
MTDQPPYPPPYPGPPPGGSGYPPPPGGYGGYGYPPPPQNYGPSTNAMALAALIASITGFITCGLGAVLGLIFGFIGLSQIKRTGDGGRGLAIAGIVISLATFGIFLIALIIGLVTDDHSNSSAPATAIVIISDSHPADLVA